MAKTRLPSVRLRHKLDYSAGQVLAMLRQRAYSLDIPIMGAGSLKTKLSRWENGHESVYPPYRRLFREIYGCGDDDLGFPVDEGTGEIEELQAQIEIANRIDTAAVERIRQQVDQARHTDRQFGGVTVLDQLRGTVDQLRQWIEYSPIGSTRSAMAGVLTEAAALAGWEALDRNALTQAWNLHEIAKTAAREAGSEVYLAHSEAQQAFILVDLGKPDLAVAQLDAARQRAQRVAPPVLRAWLAAAHGEGLASAGRRDLALRAFDDAHTQLPSDPVDPALPYLFLGGAHLDRWRGNALSKLADPDAIDQISGALAVLPGDFVRARIGMHVDLAYAYSALGDRDSAISSAREARRLAQQIKSDRQLRRLTGLRYPGLAPEAP